jgi:ATP-dependent DNA helicase RecG
MDTTQINWNSSFNNLMSKRSIKVCNALNQSGLNTLDDLLWLLPLKVHKLPSIRSFDHLQEGCLFKGKAKMISVDSRPNFHARGKGKVMLSNISATIKDCYTDKYITLKWFNSYPSVKKKLELLAYIQFSGEASKYNNEFQIVNPDYSETTQYEEEQTSSSSEDLKIQYPTINKVSGTQIKKVFDKIPHNLWESIPETLPESLMKKRGLLSLQAAFSTLHGKSSSNREWNENLIERSKNRLIYEELLDEQLKIYLRKNLIKKVKVKTLAVSSKKMQQFIQQFSFSLTKDQEVVANEINSDFKNGTPMMRLIQGDVGCGKTCMAIIASQIVQFHKKQIAFMCPTEALAQQHFRNLSESLKELKIQLLIGSTKAKDKKEIYQQLQNGEIDLIIGTHSLFQKAVKFKELGLAIIDEQHKFGVEQRLKLLSKGIGVHCLIMTATPIPRSLSLTQYGDLDISSIKTMPAGRKEIQTRIVTPNNFNKFLSFVKTRLSMKEQVYIVVPAIHESETLDLVFLEKVLEKFEKLFSEFRITGIHGELKSEEKDTILKDFSNHRIDMLISTSVIEVGIDVPNSTVMAIMNPERFGLSSLHQLRGRVGRGKKNGFCFLVTDKELSLLAMKRLRVIEKTLDGFVIAEEDLKIRGEGDLFGTDQSGSGSAKRLSNIVTHYSVMLEAREDAQNLINEQNEVILSKLNKFSNDSKVMSTI